MSTQGTASAPGGRSVRLHARRLGDHGGHPELMAQRPRHREEHPADDEGGRDRDVQAGPGPPSQRVPGEDRAVRDLVAEGEAATQLAQNRQVRPSGRLRVSMPNDFATVVMAGGLVNRFGTAAQKQARLRVVGHRPSAQSAALAPEVLQPQCIARARGRRIERR